jgi:hypothetical protein
MKFQRVVNSVTFLALSMLWSSETHACSCVRRSVELAFDAAPHVFLARISEVQYVPPPNNENERWFPQVARFSAVEVFKGTPASVENLRAGFGQGDCGTPLIAGADYLVLVGDSGEISLCSGFFGPFFWRDPVEGDEDEGRHAFVKSIREHFTGGARIGRPPSTAFGLEDSASLWFRPE